MTRSRRAKWAALVSVAAIAMASATIGATQGAFAGQTNNGSNIITALPDWRGPTVSPVAIGKNTGNATGFIKPSSVYRVYANVTDLGTPPSGTSTVTANVSNVTAGQTAVPLVAGSYPVGGQTYNYRSGTLTAGALGNGIQSFTVTATDVATNVTTVGGNVTIDNVAPAVSNMSATGGIAGRPEVGDVFALTTTEALDTFSLLSTWNGSATTVQVRFVNNVLNDVLQIWNSAGTTQVAFGTIDLGRTDFTTTTLSFNGSTMTQAGGVINVVLGGPIVGTVTTVGGKGKMTWTPAATITDRAGNALPTTLFNEPNPNDEDF